MNTVNKNRLIKTFTELASIPSPSWHEGDVMNYIIEQFDRLGLDHEIYPCGESFNLVGRLAGTKKSPSIILSGHMDTVIPCERVRPVVTATKITSDGTSILGGDDKAAIAMFIEAAECIRENGTDHGQVEILLSCAEEVGLQGIKNFDPSVLRSRMAFIFDSGGPVGRIVLRAAHHSSMEIFVKGRAAHAGIEPEKGLNAISVMAEILNGLPTGRIDDETTMNMGLISGGMATNIVAENAYCKMEFRSIDRAKMKKLENMVSGKARDVCTTRGARLKIERSLEYPGFSLEENDPVVRIATEAMKKIRIKPQFISSGGGSDTNILHRAGIIAVNLSCGMRNVHSTSEYLLIRDLVKGAELALAIIESA